MQSIDIFSIEMAQMRPIVCVVSLKCNFVLHLINPYDYPERKSDGRVPLLTFHSHLTMGFPIPESVPGACLIIFFEPFQRTILKRLLSTFISLPLSLFLPLSCSA